MIDMSRISLERLWVCPLERRCTRFTLNMSQFSPQVFPTFRKKAMA